MKDVFDIGNELPSRMFGYYLAIGDFDSALEWGKVKAHQEIEVIAAKQEKILEEKLICYYEAIDKLIPGSAWIERGLCQAKRDFHLGAIIYYDRLRRY